MEGRIQVCACPDLESDPSHKHGTGGGRVGENAAQWQNRVADTRESTKGEQWCDVPQGEELSLPGWPQQTPV